jgi:hypothetical protein
MSGEKRGLSLQKPHDFITLNLNLKRRDRERFFVSAQDYDINTDPELPQFMVFDRDTIRVSPMTSENMHTESFPVNAEKPGFFARLSTFFTHLIPWFRALTALLKTLG